jgi:prepilin-type N-terminal cleavage/methylation domain-containing protein
MKQRVRHNYGFTLIELLVVIAIIGLLSSVVLASLNSVRIKSQDTVRTSDMSQIISALALYYTDHGKFPCHAYQNSAEPDYLQPLITEGYLTRAPHDPTEDPDVGQYYDYWSFKTRPKPEGTCGAIAQLGFKIKSGATCPGSSTATDIPGHCHIFFSEPLNFDYCSDPYLTNDSNFSDLPLGCQSLADGYIGPGAWDNSEDDWP